MDSNPSFPISDDTSPIRPISIVGGQSNATPEECLDVADVLVTRNRPLIRSLRRELFVPSEHPLILEMCDLHRRYDDSITRLEIIPMMPPAQVLLPVIMLTYLIGTQVIFFDLINRATDNELPRDGRGKLLQDPSLCRNLLTMETTAPENAYTLPLELKRRIGGALETGNAVRMLLETKVLNPARVILTDLPPSFN